MQDLKLQKDLTKYMLDPDPKKVTEFVRMVEKSLYPQAKTMPKTATKEARTLAVGLLMGYADATGKAKKSASSKDKKHAQAYDALLQEIRGK